MFYIVKPFQTLLQLLTLSKMSIFPLLAINNPIMSHSKDIRLKIHKMHKLLHCKRPYSSLWHNPMIKIGKTLIYWKAWHLNGICHIADL